MGSPWLRLSSNSARLNPTASRNLLKPLPALREPISGPKFQKNLNISPNSRSTAPAAAMLILHLFLLFGSLTTAQHLLKTAQTTICSLLLTQILSPPFTDASSFIPPSSPCVNVFGTKSDRTWIGTKSDRSLTTSVLRRIGRFGTKSDRSLTRSSDRSLTTSVLTTSLTTYPI